MALQDHPSASGEKDRNFVTALARGMEVLNCFRPGDRFLGNNQISRRTGIPKSTVSRLTHTLTELGYMRYCDTLNKYQLGSAVISLGYSMLAQMDIRRVARPLMQALAEHTQASVNLGMRDRLDMVYIDTYRNTSTYKVQLDIGSRITMANTSMGRAYLCALEEEPRRQLIDQIRLSDPAAWPYVKIGIDRALKDYEEKGFCMSLGDWREEAHAIAVPFIPEDDGEIMVFSCSGATFQLTQQMLENDIGPRLINLAGNVRTVLGRI